MRWSFFILILLYAGVSLADTLRATVETGDCILSGATTTETSGTTWSFPAMIVSAPSYPATCQIRIHNQTNNAVIDIVSNAFMVTAPTTVGTLTVSVASGGCHLSGPTTTVPSGIFWSFPGLVISHPTTPATCTLKVTDTESGEFTVSNAFNVFTPTPLAPCNNTDLGSGWTCVAVTGTHLGANGGTSMAIDTTNAGPNNLLLIGIVAHELNNPMCTPTDNKGNTYTPLAKTSSQGNAIGVRLFYKVNGMVGAGHTITCTGTDTYPVSIFTAYKPADPNQGVIIENGASPSMIVSSFQTGTVTPNAANALIVTLVGTSVLANAAHNLDSGFARSMDVPGTSIAAFGGNIGASLGHRTMAIPEAVNPTWSWNGQNDIPAARIAVFHTLTPVNPALVMYFNQQPTMTVTGTPFMPPVSVSIDIQNKRAQ